MKIPARLFVFALSFFTLLSFSTPAFAQTYTNTNPNPINSYTMPETANDVPHDSHTLAQGVLYDVLSAVTCQLGGIDPLRPQYQYKCLSPDAKTGLLGFNTNNNMGLIGFTTQMIGYAFQLPVSTHDYIAYSVNNFGFQKTYAATTGNAAAVKNGVGFTSLSPLLPIWAAFRNIVYLMFVIVFILVGIAIMLRVQIDPRTVMTIENQLPKIIVGLILVTFSFAIAGILVDLMWILTFVVINILVSIDQQVGVHVLSNTTVNPLGQVATGNLFQNPIGYANEVLNNTGWGGLLGLAGASGRGLQMLLANLFTSDKLSGGSGADNLGLLPPGVDCGNTFFLSGLCAVGQFLGNTVGALLGNLIGWLLSWVIGIIAILVVLIALFVSLFRVWFMLLRVYISVILDTLLGPFIIVFGLIPGSSMGFGSWLRGFAANLLTFPTVVFIFVLARVLIDSFFVTNNQVAIPGGSLFVPPLIGNPNGTGKDNPLGGFIALGLIFIIPEINNVLKKVLGVNEIGLGNAAFGAVGAGTRFLGSSVRNIGGSVIDYKFGRQASVSAGFGAVMRGFFGR